MWKNNKKLPNSWVFTPLTSIVDINPKLDKSQFDNDLDVSFVPMPAVEAETGIIDVAQIKKFTSVRKGYTAFQEKDVLFAKITPCMENGKMAVVPKLINGLGFGSTEFHVLRAYPGILPQYVYYFVSSLFFRVESEHNMTGAVGQRRVPAPWLGKAEISIPPTNEQHRIVAKIEELFSELDKGIASLKTAREQLKLYRQSLLKHAFEGKLTEQWRKDNADKLETADELLARIQQERETRFQQQLDEWKLAVDRWEGEGKEGKKPSKPRIPKILVGFDDSALSDVPKLPRSWFWDKLGLITLGVEYGTSAKSSKEGSHPVLRMGNIQNTRFDWTDLVYTSDEAEIEKYLLNKGDVLFNRTNSPELVGKSAIYTEDNPALFAGYLIRIGQFRNIVESQYLNLFLNSYVAKQYGNSVKTDGVNQSNINGQKLSNYPFPFCVMEEQGEIVRILEEQISVVDNAKMEIESNLVRSQALRQSILKKAFSGHLVPQDPNDEPASELLKRIAAEKAEQTKTTQRVKK